MKVDYHTIKRIIETYGTDTNMDIIKIPNGRKYVTKQRKLPSILLIPNNLTNV